MCYNVRWFSHKDSAIKTELTLLILTSSYGGDKIHSDFWDHLLCKEHISKCHDSSAVTQFAALTASVLIFYSRIS